MQRELRAPSGLDELDGTASVGHLLFEDSLEAHAYSPFEATQRTRTLRIGGLPTFAISGRVTSAVVTEWVTRVIGDDLAGRFDRGITLRLLRLLASETSSIQTVASIGDALGGLKHETVLRHLDRLESAFLIKRVPAERGKVRASLRAHPKIHVADSSLSFWGGADDGHSFESFVVNDIATQLSFGGNDHEYEVSYWRDNRGRTEVDLVVTRNANQRVGIEIKLAAAVSSGDAAGLRALRADGVIERGFVVYSGPRMYEVEDGIWALPVTALWEPPRQTGRRRVMSASNNETVGPGQVSVFLSYVHKDDESWGGAIVRTARDLVTMLESETGETVRLFTDHDIAWGQEWKRRLSDELDAATFLIPVVSPLYLRSEACRAELLEFSSKVDAQDRRSAILPLVWKMPAALTGDVVGDEVVSLLRDAQFVDWTNNRALDRESGVYRGALVMLAERLQKRLTEESEANTSTAQQPLPLPDDSMDVMAEMAAVESRFEPVLRRFEAATTDYMTAFASVEQPENPSAGQLSEWAGAVAAALGSKTTELGEARDEVAELLATMGRMLDVLRRPLRDDPSLREQLLHDTDLDGWELGIDGNEIRAMMSQLDMIGAFFAPLREPLQSLRAAVQMIGDVETRLRSWRQLMAGR